MSERRGCGGEGCKGDDGGEDGVRDRRGGDGESCGGSEDGGDGASKQKRRNIE